MDEGMRGQRQERQPREVAERAALALTEALVTDDFAAVAAQVADVLGQGEEDRKRSIAQDLTATRAAIEAAPSEQREVVQWTALRQWAERIRHLLEDGTVTVAQALRLAAEIRSATDGFRGFRGPPPAPAAQPPFDAPGIFRGGPPGTSFGDDGDDED